MTNKKLRFFFCLNIKKKKLIFRDEKIEKKNSVTSLIIF